MGNSVIAMETLDDSRSILVTLASNVKCDSDTTMTTKCYAIMGSLETFDWKQLNVGTIYSIIGNLAGVHILASVLLIDNYSPSGCIIGT